MIQLLALNLAAIALLATLLWLVSVGRRDASIVDPCWGLGFVAICGLSLSQAPEITTRAWLLTVLVTVWGLRLSIYLLWRNGGQGEDHRYAEMRAHHGPRFWLVSLLTVFWLQAVVLWWVAWPIQAGIWSTDSSAIGLLDLAGCLLWAIGLCFETVGDWQLAAFRANPANAGQVLDRGLWRYTRHPNYFGDFCVWWGIYLIAASGGAWWTLGSPLAMSWFLMRVSGVTLLERTIVERRPQYRDYMARTNAFFPGPAREPSSAPIHDVTQMR
jgi:steroid 5-alpha reductase family enzyme